jgi:hypothetical protein
MDLNGPEFMQQHATQAAALAAAQAAQADVQAAAERAEFIRQVTEAVAVNLRPTQPDPTVNAQHELQRTIDTLFLRKPRHSSDNATSQAAEDGDAMDGEVDDDASDDEFLIATKVRAAGRYTAPPTITDIIPRERINIHLTNASFKKLFRHNPEPRNGIFRSPVIDEEFRRLPQDRQGG